MSVWLTIPSKRPPAEANAVLKLWADRGYKIALWCDSPIDAAAKIADFVTVKPYPGYPKAVNGLVAEVCTIDPGANWFVIGGDDIEPDHKHTAQEIAQQCEDHFLTHHYGSEVRYAAERGPLQTYGVMQPTGDRWGENPNHPDPRMRSAYIDRVCGSAWIGREFATRINQGRGPLWPNFYHMFDDECLQEVAVKLGVLWQRPDLIHLHKHWARERGDRRDMPAFLEQANSEENWQRGKAEFERLKSTGFAECMPL